MLQTWERIAKTKKSRMFPTEDQLFLLQVACSLLSLRRTTSPSSSPPTVRIWDWTERHMRRRRRMDWDWDWNRHMVVLLTDVLHDVLTLAGERCLCHQSASGRDCFSQFPVSKGRDGFSQLFVCKRYVLLFVRNRRRPVIWNAFCSISLNAHLLK